MTLTQPMQAIWDFGKVKWSLAPRRAIGQVVCLLEFTRVIETQLPTVVTCFLAIISQMDYLHSNLFSRSVPERESKLNLRVLSIWLVFKPMTLGEFNKDISADRKKKLSKELGVVGRNLQKRQRRISPRVRRNLMSRVP